MNYIFLVIGFILLVKGADIFVTGSASVAKKFNISELIIGLTVVALGTSAPEIAVSTLASIQGRNEMAISNIIGSNMFNLLVVLGACSVIKPIIVKKSILKKEFPFAILATIVLLIMVCDSFIGDGNINILSSSDGYILLVFFAIFLYSIISSALDSKNREIIEKEVEEEIVDLKEISTLLSFVFIVFGLGAIVLGGDLVVNYATKIAQRFHVSDALIGLTIVAMGTSLPELVTSVIASRKGNSDMALGNVVGSNIFNILLTLGISSSISPIKIEGISIIDISILTILSIVVMIIAISKKSITRIEGLFMLAIFVAYNCYIFTR